MTLAAILGIAVFFVSLVLTMVGLGGGLIFSPLFLIMGLAKADAASASLFLNLIAAASAASTYARKRMVDFALAFPLIISSSLAAPVGAYLNARIDIQPFLLIMAVVLAAAGTRMVVSPPSDDGGGVRIAPSRRFFAGIVIGGAIGLMGGLLGIGGGIFIVPLLIYVLKTPTKIAAASSTFIVCFSSLTGFLGYASLKTVDWSFILPLAAASFAGGQIGARIMSSRMKGQSIRIIFGVVLFLLCIKLLHRALFAV